MNRKSPEEAVKDKFFAFLADVSLSRSSREHTHARRYGSKRLRLGWSNQPYSEAIEAVRQMLPQVSERSIGKALSDSMRKLFEQRFVREDADAETSVLESLLPELDSSDVLEEIARLLELLKSQIEQWTAFVFVEGVKLKVLKLEIGEATLYPKEADPLASLLEMVKNNPDFEGVLEDIARDAEHTHCYLAVDVEGEQHFADQQALRKGQNATNVLNLYLASSSHKTSSYQSIGIIGQPTIGRDQFVIKRTPPAGTGEHTRLWTYWGQLPPSRCYDIDYGKVQQWRKLGLDLVAACVESTNPQPGSVQSRIKNSVTWYGTAMNAHTEPEQFVDLITALESLFVADEKVSITQRLQDTVSHLLGGDFETREDIGKKMKELYGLRCRVVHGGEPVPRERLLELNDIATRTILAFVQQEC